VNRVPLNTDIYSEVIKTINPTVTRNAIAYRQANGVLTLSVVTVMEVIRGFQQNQSTKRLNDFVTAVASEKVLIFDQPAANLAGRIEGELVRTGRPIGMADTMIAAIALTQGLELSTGNTAHFQRIQQLGYPLALANWRV
jgi:tRNA(fMet)-specific endonuclease VapC